jgi:hypothetical protein
MTGKLYSSLFVFHFVFGTAVLFFSTCGNPIIKSMMSQTSDEIPYGTFHTSDLSGLDGYINENRSKHYSKNDPIPVRILGSDYLINNDMGKTALQDALINVKEGYYYLSLDMSGVDEIIHTLDSDEIPQYYFKNIFSSNNKCRIVSVKLSPLITKIGSEAFYGNPYLTSVSMPGVKEIEYNAFTNAYALSELYMPVNPPTMPDKNNPFGGINISGGDFIVYVPAGAITGQAQDGSYYKWAEKYLLDDGNNDFNVRFRRYKINE